MLAIDTDGIDGSEDNAGALFSPEDWAHARTRDIDPVDYLSRNDAYTFFQVLNDLIVTGPTWTNVNDLRALLILPSTHDPHRRIRIVAIPGHPGPAGNREDVLEAIPDASQHIAVPDTCILYTMNGFDVVIPLAG